MARRRTFPLHYVAIKNDVFIFSEIATLDLENIYWIISTLYYSTKYMWNLGMKPISRHETLKIVLIVNHIGAKKFL